MNKETKRIFSVGSIIGETDLIFKRDRVESYEAVNNVYVLKYDAGDFIAIMNQFPDIREEIEHVANERE
jgi:hypothetical protein